MDTWCIQRSKQFVSNAVNKTGLKPCISTIQSDCKMKSKKSPLVKTTEDFAAQTTVHGISYVFDANLSTIDRILWLGVTTLLFNLTA